MFEGCLNSEDASLLRNFKEVHKFVQLFIAVTNKQIYTRFERHYFNVTVVILTEQESKLSRRCTIFRKI